MLRKFSKKFLTVGLIASSLVISAQSAFATDIYPYVDEVESNDAFFQAKSFTWGNYANGYITQDDADNWSFYADPNQGGRPVTFSLSVPQGKHYVLSVWDQTSGGNRPSDIVVDDQSANGFYLVSFKLKADTTYRFLVYGEGPDDYSGTQKYYLSAN